MSLLADLYLEYIKRGYSQEVAIHTLSIFAWKSKDEIRAHLILQGVIKQRKRVVKK